MKHRIFLFRHGHAVPASAGMNDFERPLSERGKDEAGRLARLVAPAYSGPGSLVVSPATRTMQTSDLLLETVGPELHRVIWEHGYLADAWTWMEWLALQPDASDWLGIVGHNPGLSELATYLAGEAPEIPTSGWAEIELNGVSWAQLHRRCGKIRSFVTPKSQWLTS